LAMLSVKMELLQLEMEDLVAQVYKAMVIPEPITTCYFSVHVEELYTQ